MKARQHAGLFILLASLMLCAKQGWADSWQHAVSSRISTEFDTNPAMSPTNPGSVWRFLFEPSYTLMGRVGANELKAGLALQVARSSNKTLSQYLDSPSVFFDWSRHSDAGEFGISSKYAEIATRDVGIDSTGLVPIASTRATRTISGSWSKALSERSTLSADGAYEGVTYKGGPYVDYATQTSGLKFSYAVSEHSTPFLRVLGIKYVPVGSDPSSSLANATLGLNWKGENIELTMQAGQSKVSGGTKDMQDGVGGVEVRYTGQRAQLILNAERAVSSSGLGGFVKTDHVKGSWNYALSEHSNAGIDLDWWKNHSITINNVTTTTGVWLQRDLNPVWGMRTYYQHRIIKGGGVEGASSNMLGVSFVYTSSEF